MKYDEKYLIDVLKKNGWKPNIPEGHQLPKDWVLMALQILTIEKLDELLRR